MTIAFSAFDDRTLSLFLPAQPPPNLAPLPIWWQLLVVAVTVMVVAKSYRPILNLISPHQLMNFSYDPFHLVNTYGAFGSVTKERYEIIVEGSADPAAGDAGWRAYEFKGKPGDPRRIPRQYAPYHLRLDWLDDRATLKLLRFNPFPTEPPKAVRANLYRYAFSSLEQLRREGLWWVRSPAGEYLPPLVLDPTGSPARLGG